MTWHPDWWRPRIFVVIASSFFFMTFFVYSNYPDRGIHKKLSPDAKQGLALWQRNNCQVCHQIYGFGGFLGPDLTNIMARRPDEDWTEILTVGRKQMPAFHFNERDRTAILAYLRAVDETGQSIPEFTSLKEGVDHGHLVKAYMDGTGRRVPAGCCAGRRRCERMAVIPVTELSVEDSRGRQIFPFPFPAVRDIISGPFSRRGKAPCRSLNT